MPGTQRSLYQKAVGYSFSTEKVFCTNGVVTKVPTVEHVPPEAGAAMNWLCNRRPEKWRQKAGIEVKNNGPIIVRLSDEDLAL